MGWFSAIADFRTRTRKAGQEMGKKTQVLWVYIGYLVALYRAVRLQLVTSPAAALGVSALGEQKRPSETEKMIDNYKSRQTAQQLNVFTSFPKPMAASLTASERVR